MSVGFIKKLIRGQTQFVSLAIFINSKVPDKNDSNYLVFEHLFPRKVKKASTLIERYFEKCFSLIPFGL